MHEVADVHLLRAVLAAPPRAAAAPGIVPGRSLDYRYSSGHSRVEEVLPEEVEGSEECRSKGRHVGVCQRRVGATLDASRSPH